VEQVDLRTVGMLALIVAALVWMMVRNRRRSEQREVRSGQLGQDAAARGWEAQSGLKDGAEQHTVTGQSDGIAWKHHAFNRSGEGRGVFGARYSEWSTADVSLPGEIIVVAEASWRKASGVSKGILAQMVENATGGGKREKELYKKAREVAGGSEALKKRYFVVASASAPGERFLNEGAEAALLGWSGEPKLTIAVLWEGGLVVEVMEAMTDAAGIEKLGELGMGLARAARGK
jgi:hypothetical protein